MILDEGLIMVKAKYTVISNNCKHLIIFVDSDLNFAFHTKSTESKVAGSIMVLLANQNICCLPKHYCFCITRLSIPIFRMEYRFVAVPTQLN